MSVYELISLILISFIFGCLGGLVTHVLLDIYKRLKGE